MAGTGVEKLVGTWEYVDGEHFDDYMKEIVRIPFLLFYKFHINFFSIGCWFCSSSIS
jgi:hypothetical protein